MKNKYSWKNIVQNLIIIGVFLAIVLACRLTRDNQYENETPTPRRTPLEALNKNDSSPTPTSSPTTSSASNTSVNNSTNANPAKSGGYQDNLPPGFNFPTDSVGKRILSDYGAVYVAHGGVTPPPTVIFESDDQCVKWQSGLKTTRIQLGGTTVELQDPAIKDLQAAISEAQSASLTISPNGDDSSRRSYDDTVKLWASRVNPGLDYWAGKGRITKDDVKRIKALSPVAQVPEILKLEDQGIYFSKDLSKSILYSVAAPGTSQHLSMLALDVKENANAKVREILAKHNWYQTVSSDLPHFTYLGVPESELPKLGLKSITNDGRTFWVPSL